MTSPSPDVHSAHPMVKLSLIDVTSQFDQPNDVEPLLNEALDLGCASFVDGETIALSSSTNEKHVVKRGTLRVCSCTAGTNSIARERISKSVMRFVKPQDRYLALGSVLLKSRAYHQALFEENGGRSEQNKREGTTNQPSLALVELPRTKYGKPFIPRLGKSTECDNDVFSPTAVQHTISVSHQFPFVGIARLQTHYQKSPLHVGLDIAMYEAPNPKLYGTTSEFLDVFKDSFTPTEWGCIVDSSAAWFGRRRKSDEDSRREFYMRWAVKEAYTKALGLGLGHEFGTFDIAFECCEDDGIGGLAEAVDTLGGIGGSDAEGRDERIIAKRMTTLGKIRYVEKEDIVKNNEVWHFTLLELNHFQQGMSADVDAAGCACVCIGPFEGKFEVNAVVEEEIATLEDAIKWHQQR